MSERLQFILKGAEFQYPGLEEKILKGVDLEIRAGEWVAILGENGSGKSTLLKILSALLIPTQGVCFINGLDAAKAGRAELRGETAIVFQNPEDQTVAATVEEEVAFGPENIGCPREEIVRRVKEALSATGLSGEETRLVSSLSGGQKQRLALAGALAMKPAALLLDEATSMLDQRSRYDFIKIIAREREKGLTIVQVTHRLEEIRNADRVILLRGGVVEQEARACDFLNKSEEELAALSLEKPPLDVLTEKLKAAGVIPQDVETSVPAVCEALLCR